MLVQPDNQIWCIVQCNAVAPRFGADLVQTGSSRLQSVPFSPSGHVVSCCL
jgi:hypothetical protein